MSRLPTHMDPLSPSLSRRMSILVDRNLCKTAGLTTKCDYPSTCYEGRSTPNQSCPCTLYEDKFLFGSRVFYRDKDPVTVAQQHACHHLLLVVVVELLLSRHRRSSFWLIVHSRALRPPLPFQPLSVSKKLSISNIGILTAHRPSIHVL